MWLATERGAGAPNREPEEQGMHARRVTVGWERMVRAGEVKDAASIAAYGLLLLAHRP